MHFEGDANFQCIVSDLDGNLILDSPLRVHFPLMDDREFCPDQSIVNSPSVPDSEFVGFPLGTSFHFPASSCMSMSWDQLCTTGLSQHRGRQQEAEKNIFCSSQRCGGDRFFLLCLEKASLAHFMHFQHFFFYRELSSGNFCLSSSFFKSGTFAKASSFSAARGLQNFCLHREVMSTAVFPSSRREMSTEEGQLSHGAGCLHRSTVVTMSRVTLHCGGVLGTVGCWVAALALPTRCHQYPTLPL